MFQKNDFLELEFSGRVKDGAIFDTNIKDEAKKLNLEIEERPLIICLGQGMVLPSIEEFLIGKENGKYTLELAPEKAFGVRSREMIKTLPTKLFYEKQVMPQAGMIFNFDGTLGKISAVSGGRVIVDFNHPLANKTVIYELNIKRKLEDVNEKAEVLINLFFRRKLEFKIEENKITIEVESKFKPLIEFFKERFKEILALELEISEIKEEAKKTEEKKPEAKEEQAK